jgi:hypothetical protein
MRAASDALAAASRLQSATSVVDETAAELIVHYGTASSVELNLDIDNLDLLTPVNDIT